MRLLIQRGRPGGRRKGVILLVVLSMLTLFALVGLSFVLVADAQAASARIALDADSAFRPDIEPESAFSLFLGNLIYDVPDDATGIYNPLRGHGLARNMYGWNPSLLPGIDPSTNKPYTYQILNDKPYNGTGRLHGPTPYPVTTVKPLPSSISSTEAALMNFRFFPNQNVLFPTEGFLRDPERPGFRTAGQFDPSNPTNPGPFPPGSTLLAPNAYAGGFGVPYTYPDHNNPFLAEIDPTTGQVIVPSFHRDYLFGPLNLSDTPPNPPTIPAPPVATPDPFPVANPNWNPNWKNLQGKRLTLRPRPGDNFSVKGVPQFPFPLDAGGDVKNLDFAPGGADSIWIDVGGPIMTAPDGRRYKMLVAPLILALDGRIDLNAVGNIMGAGNTHRSNQGWGTWEVNPSKVLDSATNPTEWTHLFDGFNDTIAKNPVTNLRRTRGRYDRGADPLPGPVPNRPLPVGAVITGSNHSRGYAQVDYNGMTDSPAATRGGPSNPFTLPAAGGASAYYAFPSFPATSYGNGVQENANHASIFYALRPRGTNRRFPIESAAQLLRFGSTGGDILVSDVARLLPANLIGTGPSDLNAARHRALVTLLSADLERPGATPYVWDYTDKNTRLKLGAQQPDLSYRPSMQPVQFPALGTPTPANSEFDASWRSSLASLLRVDLNRPLTNYPAVNANGRMPVNPVYNQATADRTSLATDLFAALRQATGGLTVQATFDAYGKTSPEYNALRYLAQLAVNIVDYIDSDDVSTQFNWTANVMDKSTTPATPVHEFVYGVELPRLVINETYVQFDNDPNSFALIPVDPLKAKGPQKLGPGQHYNVNVWAELHNPMQDDNAISKYTDTTVRLSTGPVGTLTPAYRLLLAAPNLNAAAGVLRNPANVTGAPDFGLAPNANVLSTMNTWGPGPTQDRVLPANGAYSGPAMGNMGFYVIGPDATTTFVPNGDPGLQPISTFTSNKMTYTVPAGAGNNPNRRTTVLLQRLANPYLIHNASTNPWITVDFVENSATHVMDGRTFTTAGANPTYKAMNTRTSFGRPQPYAAFLAQSRAQAPVTPAAGQPKHTFFRQNCTADTAATFNQIAAGKDSTLKVPFDWLTHLDRSPTNPLELLHVSDARPHDLTQRFVTGNKINTSPPHQHVAPWTATDARLHRFFEFVMSGTRGTGLLHPTAPTDTAPADPLPGPGGRVMGKVNLNMMRDPAIFRALADAQPANSFYVTVPPAPPAPTTTTDDVVNGIYTSFINRRSPGGGVGPTDQTFITLSSPGLALQQHNPLWSLALGQAAATVGPPPSDNFLRMASNTRGIENTLLQNAVGGTTSLFNGPGSHPYQQRELLRKIYGSVTTRSNVFAVWATVGYFEVVSEDANGNGVLDPTEDLNGNGILDTALLGAEMGASENRQIRHRMFAIVDRTHLQSWPTFQRGTVKPTVSVGPDPVTGKGIAASTTAQTVTLTNPSLSHPDSATGYKWTLQANAILVYEPNTDNEETVVVAQTLPGGPFTAIFTKDHSIGQPVIVRGNPGPLQRYDPRQDRDVVPYFALID